MSIKLLYIEDDVIDVLALKRTLRHFDNVALSVCRSLGELLELNLDEYDYVLSDSNLPDAGLKDLKANLPLDKTQFISGSEITGENVWIKPTTAEQLESLFNKNSVVNMQYINDLADGDDEYVQEMIDTAISVLPTRWQSIETNKNNIVELKKAAHKTKSSYRVCGIQNQWLVELEELNDSSFQSDQKEILISQIKKQIEQAIAELKKLKA